MSMLKSRAHSTTTVQGRRPPARRLVAFVLLAGVCWVTLFTTIPSPTGEPVLRATSPGNGETVKSPDQVVLTFDRPVPAGLATVRILDPDGDQIVFERPVHPQGNPDAIAVPMPQQRYEGTYAAAWTLPSRGLEPVGGTFTFDVNSPIPPQGLPEIETTHDTTVAVIHTAARFAAVAALVLLVGATFFVAFVWPAGAERKSLRRLVTWSWAGLVAATLAVFASFGPYAAWVPLSDAFDPRLLSGTLESDAGRILLARLYVLIPAGLGLAQLMTAPTPETTLERRWRGGAVLGCAAAVAATWSLPGDPSPLALTLDTVLLTAIAVAVGGLVTLAIRSGTESFVLPRFFRAAAVCAVLFIAIAAYLAVWHGVVGTSYGWLLAGMCALVVLLAVTGLIVRRRPAMPMRGAFRGRIGAAAGVAMLLVAGTAVLVVAQAPRTAHAQEPASPPQSMRDQVPPSRVDFDTGNPVGQGSLDFVLIPSNGGSNRAHVDLHLSVLDTHDSVKDDMTLTAVFDRPDHTAPAVPVQLGRVAPGYSRGSATIPVSGRWELTLTLKAPDGSQQTLTQAIDVS